MTATARWASLAGLFLLSALLLAWYAWPDQVAESDPIRTVASRGEKSRASHGGPSSERQPTVVVSPNRPKAEPEHVDDLPALNVQVTDGSGQPIAGALVCAQPSSETMRLAATSNCRSADGDGIATWSSAPAAESRVTASAPGFSAQERQVQGSETVTIALQSVPSVVSGQVEDSNGGPVVEALVLVLEAEGEKVLGTSLSDSTGAFAVSAPAGPSQLRVVADGYGSWQRDIMAPGSGLRVVLALGSIIRGHVTETVSSQPVSGVVVQAARHDSATGSFGRTTTLSDGSFTIRNLGSGTHLVRIVDEDWAADSQEVWLDLGATAVADFAAARASAVEVMLTVAGEPCPRGGLSLHGPSAGAGSVREGGLVRVSGLKPGSYEAVPYCANSLPAVSKQLSLEEGDVLRESWDLAAGLSIRGRVTGAGGEDTQGLTVRAFDPKSGQTAECITAEQGVFTCGGLVAGQYRCSVNQDDVELSNVVEVELTNDSAPAEVELTLTPSGAVGVTVENEQGKPLDNLQLALKAPGKIPLPAEPLGDGRSEFHRIPVGNYDLLLEGSEAIDVQRRVLVEPGKMTEVSLVLPARDVEGWVLDAAGAAQPDTWVSVWGVSSLRGRAPEAEAMTDAEGRFLLRGLVRSRYAIRVEGPSGTILRNPVEVDGPLKLYLEDQAGADDSAPAQAGPEPVLANQTSAASKPASASAAGPAKQGSASVAPQPGAAQARGDVAASGPQPSGEE